MWDLIGISDPTAETGRTLFNFNQMGYTDPNGIVWNFDTPWLREQEALARANNPSGMGFELPGAYNLGDQYYKDLGFTGQAWNMPTLEQQVSGGQIQGTMTPEFQQWLADQGYVYGTGQAGSTPYRGYFDKYGNIVGNSLQAGASDSGALGEFVRNALGLYTLGQGFGALSGATGATGATGAAPALTGVDEAMANLAAAGGITPEAMAAGGAAAGAASGAVGPGLKTAAGTAAGIGGAASPSTASTLGNLLSNLGAAGDSNYLKYLIPALAALGGTALQQKGISDAQEAQNNATAAANALAAQNLDKILAQQKQIFDIQRQDQAPWLQAGQNALTKLSGILDKGLQKYTGDPSQEPGYQFGLTEGQKAIDRTAAARGNLLSGANLKAAMRYANDYATGKYNDSFNRYWAEQNNMLDPLYRAAGFGTSGMNAANAAAQNYGNASSNALSGYGSIVGNNMLRQGNAAGGAAIERGNLYGNLLAQLGGLGYQYFGG